MNERIWELAKQAQSDDMPYDSNIPAEFIVRLSELIVRECVAEARDDCAGWTERDQCLVMQVMDRIMLHFGVEE